MPINVFVQMSFVPLDPLGADANASLNWRRRVNHVVEITGGQFSFSHVFPGTNRMTSRFDHVPNYVVNYLRTRIHSCIEFTVSPWSYLQSFDERKLRQPFQRDFSFQNLGNGYSVKNKP